MPVSPTFDSGLVLPQGPTRGGSTPITPSNSWVSLSYDDATLVDTASVINTFDGTDAITTATAATFESTSGTPPRWKWTLSFDPADYLAMHIYLNGVSFPSGASNGVGVIVADGDTPASSLGLVMAKTSSASAKRVSSGRAWTTLSDQNPGIDGDILYGRVAFYQTTGPVNVIDDAHAYLLDSSGVAGNGNHSTNATGLNWSPGSSVVIAVAIQQNAAIQTFTPGALSYRLIPRPT